MKFKFAFRLESVPGWMPIDDRFCRACDQETMWVVVAERTSHIYPCCNNELCQAKVREKIIADLNREKADA